MTLNVADISRYQDTSVIPALRGGGTDAVIVGVTFGCAGANPIYAAQLTATALNGMLRGAYHIRARVNWTPQQEADFFLSHMTGYLDGRTILVLDWEECDTSDEAWALAWLQYVEARTGIKPWFYVNFADLTRYQYPSIAANGNAIWLAQYPYSTVNGYAGVNWQPQAIPAGHTLAAWQYVGTGGTVNGVGQLDLSVAYLNSTGWLAYANPSSAQANSIAPITDWFTMATQQDLIDAITRPDVLDAIALAVLKRPCNLIDPSGETGQITGTTTLAAKINWMAHNDAQLLSAVATLQPGLLSIAQGIGDLKAAPTATATIDVPALAAQIAAALNTDQAHQLLVELGNALPKA